MNTVMEYFARLAVKRMGLRPHVIAMAGWMLMAGAAYCGDAPLPPEVQALVGMKLPPIKIKGTEIKRSPLAKPLPPDYVLLQPANIPKFIYLNGAIIWEEQGNFLAYEEGLANGKWPAFIMERISKDKLKEILDIQLLPTELISWQFADERFQFLKGRLSLSQHCRSVENDKRIIFGLMQQEKGKETCAHYSSRVKQAWQIDQGSGHIRPIPTQGLQCYYISEDKC